MTTTFYEGPYSISTDTDKLNVDLIHQFLSTASYWAQDIPKELVEKCIAGSLCFGLYHGTDQIGFARLITDQASFAYLADVFVLPEWRGKGLSKFLMRTIMDYPSLQGLRRWMLMTSDAHGLYKQFGFGPLEDTSKLMNLSYANPYTKKSS
ncbi:acetyltransferase (GNAT) family protein [Chitinophaga dinghuensis]|uniref:Acetyltransferase (GNAT) family protein n=1 Tax=Chitinophaga dinghuensis TaxID=1539050 RepID=A0A327WBP9_9BACT|nr:GNAT family N-acetyltransferase [Chitinophaga dinghuensis]RAJ83548.1 acetyltransferase (GNAT) family protein [Chitinophaga dinghuensis]